MKNLGKLLISIYTDSFIDGSQKLHALSIQLGHQFSNQKLHTKNNESIEI